MPVLYIYENPQASLETYDRVSAQVRTEDSPSGMIHHIASRGDAGGIVVVEVWENEESHDKWDQTLRQKIAAAGGPPRKTPRKMTVHNMVSGAKTS